MKLLALVLLVGCGGPPAAAPAPSTTTRSMFGKSSAAIPLDLTVRARAERGTTAFGVAPNDTLHSGDFLELFVMVNQPAYVYVVQFFGDGRSTVVYPDQDVLLQPGREHRIPAAADEALQLDDKRGDENLYFLMTRTPVASADAAIAGAIADIRASEVAPATAAKPAPRPPREDRFLTLATRGVKIVKRPDNATAITGSAARGDDALVVVRFSFRHD
ncbi:MAG: DUF4384 domain-containing protein [Kofleriaceae bacterium]